MTGVVLDVHAAQSPLHPERGIARSVTDLARAMERRHPEAMVAYSYCPHLELGVLPSVVPARRLVPADEVHRLAPAAVHLGSVFEGTSLDRFLPPSTRSSGAALVVTLQDLIPLLHPELYLTDPWARRRYLTRVQLVRSADLVLCISEHTARDAVEHLGLRPDRVVVTGLAPADHFVAPASPEAPRQVLTAALDGAAPRPGYVLFPGATDPRKNLRRLVEGYQLLDPELRRAHQLVVACRVGPSERAELDGLLDRLGIAGDVLVTGLVGEEVLVALYQAAHLVVFPSSYEGYGLPVMEARRCGAPTIAARTSSLVELLDDEALFDPSTPAAIAAALGRALGDPAVLAALRDLPEPPGHTWREVADATAVAYRRVLGRRRRRPRGDRLRIAYVTPLPPEATGVADHSFRTLERLAEVARVEAFTANPRDARVPEGVGLHSPVHLGRVQAGRGAFDAVVHCWGNSRFHVPLLGAVRDWPGIVIAHDVAVAGLYEWCGEHQPDAIGGTFAEAVERMYGGALPPALAAVGRRTYADLDRCGVTMAREVLGWSTRFLVHSEAAAAMVRADAPPEHRDRVGVLPFAVAAGRPRRRRGRLGSPPLVASFGIVQPSKAVDLLLDAFALVHAADPRTRLVLVGDVGDGMRRDVHARADRLGVGPAVLLTGRIPLEQYEDWLQAADVAVQLRSSWNGESSGALADALGWGIPTITSDVGAAASLGRDAAVRVPVGAAADRLADAIVRLLTDPVARTRLSAGAAAHTAAHGFDRTVAELLAIVEAQRARPAAAAG
jgi:glycosyltransferase involved in cell wall biosynthesis